MAEYKKDDVSFRAIFERFYRPQMASFANRGFSIEESLDLTEEAFLRFCRIQPVLAELIKRLEAQDPKASTPSAAWVVRELHSMAIDRGIVHRDLKAENVMLLPAEEGGAAQAKITDFGLAKTLGTVEDDPVLDHRLTIEEEIEHLYDKITVLSQDQPTDDDSIEQAFSRLRALQKAEAEQYRARFEAGLEMPIDAGKRILARAHALRIELEDLAAQDAAPQNIGT